MSGPEDLANLLNLERPLVFIDVETTTLEENARPDPDQDRIVSLAVMKVYPDAKVTQYQTLINPCVPIARSSTYGDGARFKGHGITDDMVKDAPKFTDRLGRGIVAGLDDSDLAGFNARRYDFRVITAHCQRAGFEYDGQGVQILDLYLLWASVEPRDLAAFVRRFLGVDGFDGHQADIDVAAVVAGLPALLAAFPQLPRKVSALAEICYKPDPTWIHPRGKIRWKGDTPTMCFGKHDTQDMRRVPASYWDYILRSNPDPPMKRLAEDALAGVYPTKDGVLPLTGPANAVAAPTLFDINPHGTDQ